MKQGIRLLALLIACFGLNGAWAAKPGDRIDNFRLLDQAGASHELYYLSDMKAVVIMTHGNGCPIVRKSLSEFKALRDRFGAQGVEFLMLNSNLQDDYRSVQAEAKEFSIDVPIMIDDTQLIGEALGVERTAEVFVIDPKHWRLVYRGPVDDRLDYGAAKPAATRSYLADTLQAVLAEQAPPLAQVDGPGCIVNFPERAKRDAHAKISYEKTIAPLLQDKCVACHRVDGVAPWAMSDYTKVLGFAPMMREVIRTKRMPPWHADPHYGSFVGDRSLSVDDTKTLVHWIEAGAPRGDGADPLATSTKTWSQWALGEPDLIIDVPAFKVPANGLVTYQYPRVLNPLQQDVWIRAIEVMPGDRSVVHHALAGVDDGRGLAGALGNLGSYAPGKNAAPYPDDTGVPLRKGAHFQFQMHYTPSGKEVTDKTRLGLYFYDREPKHELKMAVIYDTALAVPPNTKAYTQSLNYVFKQDVMLYSLVPHAHLRGKSAKYTAHYADGHQEVLLSVPKYDFNWQPTYFFKDPMLMPAGTKIVLEMTWDNSRQNPLNPNPDHTVRWGDQTWEEMNVGWLRFREVGRADAAALSR